MPGETDFAELQALQRKAYGRGGQLTEAETERLRALEDSRRPFPVAAPPTRRENVGGGSTGRDPDEPSTGPVDPGVMARPTVEVAHAPDTSQPHNT
ncbi:MAG: hypothetical protein K0Q52_1297, partial [Microbacterium sp.]|nr:hypothetical protein [Microbacterium sp.]